MTAKTFRTKGIFPFQGWCNTCQDGANGSRVAADEWVTAHNRKNHPTVRNEA